MVLYASGVVVWSMFCDCFSCSDVMMGSCHITAFWFLGVCVGSVGGVCAGSVGRVYFPFMLLLFVWLLFCYRCHARKLADPPFCCSQCGVGLNC